MHECEHTQDVSQSDTNMEVAIHYYILAADQVVKESQFWVGRRYRKGVYNEDGTVLLEPNTEQSIEILTMLVNENIANAKYELGIIFWNGWKRSDNTQVP